MSIKIGILGAGSIGEVHAIAAAKAGLSVTWIADLALEKAQKLAADCKFCQATDKPQDVFASSDVDAVVICVPNRWHKDLAIEAMRAGKDVLLEKPMGLNATQSEAINAASAETGQLLQVGMSNRFSAVGVAAKQIVDSGDLGQIYHAKAHFLRRRGVPGLGGWFTNKQLSGGGPLIDLGVHVIDMASWLMGFPQCERVSGKVYAHFGKRMKDYVYEDMWAGPPRWDGVCDVEDSAHAMLHFGNGASLDLQVSWAMNMPTPNMANSEAVVLLGDRGGLSFKLGGTHVDVATEKYGHNVDTRLLLPTTEHFTEQARAFRRCVESREPPLATGEQGHAVQSIIDAIYESSSTNREVSLD